MEASLHCGLELALNYKLRQNPCLINLVAPKNKLKTSQKYDDLEVQFQKKFFRDKTRIKRAPSLNDNLLLCLLKRLR
jgi:hypothetical protein